MFSLASHYSFILAQLVMKQLFWQSAALHPYNVFSPSGLCFLQKDEDAGHVVGAFKDICVGGFVLPSDAQKFADPTQMKVVELAGVSIVDSRGLISKEESGENHLRLTPLCSQTFSRSLPKTELALSILLLTSV